MKNISCLVIGAGQCGLAAARRLQKAGVDYLLVDKHQQVGQVWRTRPKNLVLFTSRQFCGLPDMAFPGDPQGYPDKDEVADYLSRYASEMKLNLQLGQEVTAVMTEDDDFVVSMADGTQIKCHTIINATGSNQLPIIPAYAKNLNADVMQHTAESYSEPEQLPQGMVAVIGDGASGRQIANELASSHKVILATGRNRGLVPNRLLGQDIFWWLSKTGVLFQNKKSLVAKIMQKRNPIPCGKLSNAYLSSVGVEIMPRTVEAQGAELIFDDGSQRVVDAVVWCVGYRDDTSWLKLPHCVDGQGFIEQYGVTPQPGLFVVGRKWLRNRASELIMGADKDAGHVTARVVEYLQQRA